MQLGQWRLVKCQSLVRTMLYRYDMPKRFTVEASFRHFCSVGCLPNWIGIFGSHINGPQTFHQQFNHWSVAIFFAEVQCHVAKRCHQFDGVVHHQTRGIRLHCPWDMTHCFDTTWSMTYSKISKLDNDHGQLADHIICCPCTMFYWYNMLKKIHHRSRLQTFLFCGFLAGLDQHFWMSQKWAPYSRSTI